MNMLGLALLLAGYSSLTLGDGYWEHTPYQLGQGLTFPQQGLNIGGYLNLHYSNLEQQEGRLTAQDLSLFVSKNFSRRWQLFSEIDIGNAVDYSSIGLEQSDTQVYLERLYADYRSTPEITFRFGKFLTPVGHWNQIHADPLVWTADRPLTTAAPFARHASGVMMYGDIPVGENSLEYNLFGDDSERLDPLRENEVAFQDIDSEISPRNAFKRAVGGRASYHFLDDAASVGISYVRFVMYDLDKPKDLYGVDTMWTINDMEFSGEWIYRNGVGSPHDDERGGFFQAVLPMVSRLYLVGRYERYSAADFPPTATITTLGVNFRPVDAVAIKFEHRQGTSNELMAPSGWLGSVAVLF
jgi:hypothetical protein